MLRNYFKVALRQFSRNKGYSTINLLGLSVGMAVAVLIALWINDEFSFNRNFENYNKIARVMMRMTVNGQTGSQRALPYVMGDELRRNYGSDFKYVSMASWTGDHILADGEKKIIKSGGFYEPTMPKILSLKMVKGSQDAMADNHSIILSASSAKAMFGDADPVNKIIRIDNKFEVKVTGIYNDLPLNCEFHDLEFIAPWQLYIDDNNWALKETDPWSNNSFQTYVQLAEHSSMDAVSAKIKDARLKKANPQDAAYKPEVFLNPMWKWRLYSGFQDGSKADDRISMVWLFAAIGFFILLLACINFMNLSTARSVKRAKEVGIRKSIGSARKQLIFQFFFESFLFVVLAFALSLVIAYFSLPFFNAIAEKEMKMPFLHPVFWLLALAFIVLTGIIAASYPSFYLSSFNAVKVLKGTFKAGPNAALPRKVLVVGQFAVSLLLIIGTIVVFRQIEHAKSRPIGYDKSGLISVPVVTEEIHKHFDVVRNELKDAGVVRYIAESSSPTYYVNEFDGGFEWPGKDPSLLADFGVVYGSEEFGRTVGWTIKEGRDFSNEFGTDSLSIIVNESAVRFMGMEHPVGEVIKWNGKQYHIIGVIKNMVMGSPYSTVFRTIFLHSSNPEPIINVRISPNVSIHDALPKIEAVFKKYNPAQPFVGNFADEQYASKFKDEKRTGKLVGVFALLAIFISCLGLVGMANFTAEQRTKEIGVRKVLGASVLNLWGWLSKEFLRLVVLSFLIAMPIAYYYMHKWLQQYDYRTVISWDIFLIAATGLLVVTLASVSYQSIKAAAANPVKSLKTE